jgi:hypothetical protein
MRFGLIIFFAIFSSLAQAWPITLSLGYRQQSANVGTLGDTQQKGSLQIGLEAPVIQIGDNFVFVSGASYIRRLIAIQNFYPKRSTYYEATYLDIPFRAQFNQNQNVALWIGPSLAVSLGSKCTSDLDDGTCSIKDEKRVMIPFAVGFNLIFSEFGFGFFYEMTSSLVQPNEITSQITSYRAGGINIFYRF